MSVIEKLKAQAAAKVVPITESVGAPKEPIKPDDPGAVYGLTTVDIGNGLRQWAGYVDETLAVRVLEANTHNRPLSEHHAKRIAGQMQTEKWRLNGETVKISSTGDVLDGQHRLWAVIYSKSRVWLIFVFGVAKDAFSTIDTIRKSRNGSDVIAIAGLSHHRGQTAGALLWLLRYQRGVMSNYRSRENRVENADIEAAFAAHPEIVHAVEQIMHLRRVANPSILGFVNYLLASHDPDLAERMIKTLHDPSRVPLNDPFCILRDTLMRDGNRREREPQTVIALIIKAINAARADKSIDSLSYRGQGEHPEIFPTLWWLPAL